MGRWLAPLLGMAGLVALVSGLLWAELDRGTMGGVPLVAAGAALLAAGAAVAASVESATRRRHPFG